MRIEPAALATSNQSPDHPGRQRGFPQALQQVVQVLAGSCRGLLQEQRVDTNPQGSLTTGPNTLGPSGRTAGRGRYRSIIAPHARG